MNVETGLKIRRSLISVSDKTGVVELAQALEKAGSEIIATGRTAKVLSDAGISVTPVEKITGMPEAFGGRMKTLSFQICSGILYRRNDPQDLQDIERLKILPIDCVVVNFYPFEKKALDSQFSQDELIEHIDIGGPTLVRAAAKNAPDVLVLTSPSQYGPTLQALKKSQVSKEWVTECARDAWTHVLAYDKSIENRLSANILSLRYGENPHQSGHLNVDRDSPLDWLAEDTGPLTTHALSFNNILDASSAYALVQELKDEFPEHTSVVIVKHNGPCGVASLNKASQLQALQYAWEGDPVSAFGGVLCFSDPLEAESAQWLSERFVELVCAPQLTGQHLQPLLQRRKNLKAVRIRTWDPALRDQVISVIGGTLEQNEDQGLSEDFKSVTKIPFSDAQKDLARFGVLVCRALKSNAVTLVSQTPNTGGGKSSGFFLVGAGQGQPNRIEALQALALPRAKKVLEKHGLKMPETIFVSDAFFPFDDAVRCAHDGGIRTIVQPGGSVQDKASIAACDELGMAMAFTGIRHFRHL